MFRFEAPSPMGHNAGKKKNYIKLKALWCILEPFISYIGVTDTTFLVGENFIAIS